jgi:hypothetical protein
MNFLRKGSHSVWKLSALLAASLALISQISVEAAGKTVKKVAGKSPDALTLYAQKNFLAASQAFYKTRQMQSPITIWGTVQSL